eukprot:5154934-Amphidinium_carterae.1
MAAHFTVRNTATTWFRSLSTTCQLTKLHMCHPTSQTCANVVRVARGRAFHFDQSGASLRLILLFLRASCVAVHVHYK